VYGSPRGGHGPDVGAVGSEMPLVRWRDLPATCRRAGRKCRSKAFVGLDLCRASFALALVLECRRLGVNDRHPFF
jgi:hypothetical protein